MCRYRIGTFDMSLVTQMVCSDVMMYFHSINDEEGLMRDCPPIGTMHMWAKGIVALYPKYDLL